MFDPVGVFIVEFLDLFHDLVLLCGQICLFLCKQVAFYLSCKPHLEQVIELILNELVVFLQILQGFVFQYFLLEMLIAERILGIFVNLGRDREVIEIILDLFAEFRFYGGEFRYSVGAKTLRTRPFVFILARTAQIAMNHNAFACLFGDGIIAFGTIEWKGATVATGEPFLAVRAFVFSLFFGHGGTAALFAVDHSRKKVIMNAFPCRVMSKSALFEHFLHSVKHLFADHRRMIPVDHHAVLAEFPLKLASCEQFFGFGKNLHPFSAVGVADSHFAHIERIAEHAVIRIDPDHRSFGLSAGRSGTKSHFLGILFDLWHGIAPRGEHRPTVFNDLPANLIFIHPLLPFLVSKVFIADPRPANPVSATDFGF
ncbi:MAG: hypothetical protein K9M51_01500 [Candidatus Gracilibacteria bacterium]|nr:hypothetical protein [Candidatus Gracilibacteria bacterium]